MNKRKLFLIAGIVFVLTILFWQLFLRDMKIFGKANLTWNASSETDIKGYKIYYGTEKRKGDCPKDGAYKKKVDVGNVTSYQLENLNDSSTYYFSVTSYNTGGKESCFSEEMSKTVKLSIFDKMKTLFKK
ncbi:MAG: fibronectin type III domain-containing protein [Candidatus Moranbacteria bacterium]|nr:fibronectin type III domain-containing protein [Candidatus Moranbacteria bacterium]